MTSEDSPKRAGGHEPPVRRDPPLSRDHSDVLLERLLRLHPKRIDLSLGRLKRLLKALGHPERRLPPTIHVAGTNGKGSVCAFLRAGLAASGAQTHVYTSPHLTRFHERIRLAGRLVEEDVLADALARCEAANGDAPITFFEITTAAAFLLFAETPADWLVLEVGLGGRLDATNVIPAPRAAVITSIGLDHQEFLGETLAEIAAEKAGILKPGVVAAVAEQHPSAAAAIQDAAVATAATLLVEGKDWTARQEASRLVYETGEALLDLPAPRLLGAHQTSNAGLALTALRLAGAPEPALSAAMTEVVWPGRLQRLRHGPLVDLAGPDVEIWLDGGHNPAAGRALAAFFADLEERASAPIYVIAGMLSSKDPEAFLAAFAGLARKVYGAPIEGEPNALSASDVAQAAVRAGLAAEAAGSLEQAIRMIRVGPTGVAGLEPARVVICGSLYLAGRLLRDHR